MLRLESKRYCNLLLLRSSLNSLLLTQVLTEVYMTNEIEVQPHQLLGLILCKLGDSCQVQHLSCSTLVKSEVAIVPKLASCPCVMVG